MTSTLKIVEIADEWLGSHKVTEAWRIVNMLRDELVRVTDQSTVPEVQHREGDAR